MISYFRYVPHGFVHLYESLGWETTPALSEDPTHGHWSTYMKWAGNGEPKDPKPWKD